MVVSDGAEIEAMMPAGSARIRCRSSGDKGTLTLDITGRKPVSLVNCGERYDGC